MHQLFDDPDLTDSTFECPISGLEEQAELVANGALDLAAYVMRSDAGVPAHSHSPKRFGTSLICRICKD